MKAAMARSAQPHDMERLAIILVVPLWNTLAPALAALAGAHERSEPNRVHHLATRKLTGVLHRVARFKAPPQWVPL